MAKVAEEEAAAAEAKRLEEAACMCETHRVVGVLAETMEGECRVALTPDSAVRLRKLGFEILVEAGCGIKSSILDEHYEKLHSRVVSREEIFEKADIIFKVNPPTDEELSLTHANQTIVSYVRPAENSDLIAAAADKGLTLMAMDCVPRITTAQKLDSLSSMGKISGYRSIIESAYLFGRFWTNQITAAGKYPPAKVMVIGAGVAGLEAIGVAKALGAVVRCFDTRPVCKEQVESMGAEFLEVSMEEDGEGKGGYAKVMSEAFIAAEMQLFKEQASEVDIIITTAMIPGRKAPILLKREHVEVMKTGSVIVDLAALTGGNCELTEKDELVNHNGVFIVGHSNFPSRMARQSSEMYGANLFRLLEHMNGLNGKKSDEWKVDMADTVIRPMVVVHEGNLTWPPPKVDNPSPAKAKERALSKKSFRGAAVKAKKPTTWTDRIITLTVVGIVTGLIAAFCPEAYAAKLMVFALACIVGYNSIWNVTAALHTPLMSVSNAISGVVLIGGIIQVAAEMDTATMWLANAAVLIASINVFGGFWVTQRMLQMFVVKS
jgi:NAD(P) transhydrogenase subunit alpha